MAGALIYITDAGRAALVAPGNAGTNKHEIVEIGLSTGWFDSTDRTLKKLPNELKRITTFSGENVAFDTLHVTLRDDTADQYKLYGFGLYLENGVLAGVYCQNAADGPIMEKSPAALLLLSADVQFTTIDAAQLFFGNANFTNPPATTERQGVVELATQAEVNAGADDSRAITPKGAATRYAALTGASFTGPVRVATVASDTDAQLSANGASGALGREGKLRFYGTFGTGTDTGSRFLGSIRGGFGAGAWGKEYLDFWLNTGAVNDTQSDANQSRVMRLVSGGRALFNNAIDDTVNALQVTGSIRAANYYLNGQASGDSGVFGFSNANGPAVGAYGTGTIGAGSLVFRTAGIDRARFTTPGRFVVGGGPDDGLNLLQVLGNARTYGTHTAGVAGTATAWISSDISNGYFQTAGNAYVGSAGATGILILTAGNTERARLLQSGRLLLNTQADDGTSILQTSGPIAINRTSGATEGQLLAGQNDGYFFGNTAQAGWYSPTKGAFRYNFADQSLTVGKSNYVVWHAGNLPNPLDKGGGSMTGQLLLAEGTVTAPGLSFVNDGAPDTGFFHLADGSFGITCNGVEQGRWVAGSGLVLARRPTFAGATPWDSANITPLDRNTGGQINGNVTLYGASDYGSQLIFNSNGYAPRVQVQASSQVFMVTNGANTAANLTINDAGVVSFPRARPTWLGATPWDTGNFNPASHVAKAGDSMTGRLNLTMPNSGGELGLRSTDGTYMFLRGRGAAGGMEWINNAYNNIVARMDDGGNFTSAGSIYTGNGGGTLATDGNVYGGVWGGWLSNWLNSNISNLQNNINGKANAGAQCQWSSGVVEFGSVNVHTEGTADLGAPWVMVGLRRVGDGVIYIRGTWLRNQ